MNRDRYLQSLRKSAQQSVKFFASHNKPYRERWVVRAFLQNLGIRVFPFQVRSEVDDPPDVRFRDAAFEVKEVLDPGRRRHAEYKAYAEKAAAARDVDELVEHYTPVNVSITELVDLARAAARDFENHYAASTRAQLDLLVYINLKNVHEIDQTVGGSLLDDSIFGFRSISLLKGNASYVVTSSDAAPAFIRENCGRLVHRS